MNKYELQTPAILVDLDILENNIKKFQVLCNKHGKKLWPMVKTHKSTEIVKLQQKAGAAGFLCGTLDECECISKLGIKNIMYAYPVAGKANINRVIELSKKCNFIIRLDNLESAKMINQAAEAAKVKVNYTIKINSGLNRFGILPEEVGTFASALKDFKNLVFKGISTHPGHVYAASSKAELPKYINDEKLAIQKAVKILKAAGYDLELISSGSTPTFFGTVDDEYIKVYHPGNYVFNDNTQMAIGNSEVSECALTVLTTIVSHPAKDLFICDAGAKSLGLDLGAHGNASIKGYGFVKGHPEITVFSLSEEVGKLKVNGLTNLQVGDMIEIIPNHACSTANLTSYLIGYRGNKIERLIKIDMRGNSTTKMPAN